jgi:hypothetical protein
MPDLVTMPPGMVLLKLALTQIVANRELFGLNKGHCSGKGQAHDIKDHNPMKQNQYSCASKSALDATNRSGKNGGERGNKIIQWPGAVALAIQAE